MAKKLDRRLFEAIKGVTAKRPKTVIEHILKHGFVTTAELKDKYGYDHPPRAARDVREQGIPLETFKVRGEHGRMIAAYRFGDPKEIERHKLGGRKTLPKELKTTLYRDGSGRCACCFEPFEDRYLQVDHRIPYEVTGENSAADRMPSSFMLLCGSCQRAKSWSCEHCENWQKLKNPKVCTACYWASPEKYEHIAMTAQRRVELVWSGPEVEIYRRVKGLADKAGVHIGEYIKQILE